jgi:hypothetical protein
MGVLISHKENSQPFSLTISHEDSDKYPTLTAATCRAFLLLSPLKLHALQPSLYVILEKLRRLPQERFDVSVWMLDLEVVQIIQTLQCHKTETSSKSVTALNSA